MHGLLDREMSERFKGDGGESRDLGLSLVLMMGHAVGQAKVGSRFGPGWV